MDTTISPYEVLGVQNSASVADIRAAFKRLALRTHPDKQICDVQGADALSVKCSFYPFYVVKEASELLLDPLRRAQYDYGQEQMYVRSVGAVSDTYDLGEFDFSEKMACGSTDREGRGLILYVYTLECRCGGVFEVFITEEEMETQGVNKRCECDCCSLVILVTRKTTGMINA